MLIQNSSRNVELLKNLNILYSTIGSNWGLAHINKLTITEDSHCESEPINVLRDLKETDTPLLEYVGNCKDIIYLFKHNFNVSLLYEVRDGRIDKLLGVENSNVGSIHFLNNKLYLLNDKQLEPVIKIDPVAVAICEGLNKDVFKIADEIHSINFIYGYGYTYAVVTKEGKKFIVIKHVSEIDVVELKTKNPLVFVDSMRSRYIYYTSRNRVMKYNPETRSHEVVMHLKFIPSAIAMYGNHIVYSSDDTIYYQNLLKSEVKYTSLLYSTKEEKTQIKDIVIYGN